MSAKSPAEQHASRHARNIEHEQASIRACARFADPEKAIAALVAAVEAVEQKIVGCDVLFDPNPTAEGEQERYDRAQEALYLVGRAILDHLTPPPGKESQP